MFQQDCILIGNGRDDFDLLIDIFNEFVESYFLADHLIDLFEFGDGQEYQTYFDVDLAGSLASGDVELVIGLDQANNDSFVMPVRRDVEVFEDEALHRHQRQGYYGWAEVGFGVLDNRRVLAGSF